MIASVRSRLAVYSTCIALVMCALGCGNDAANRNANDYQGVWNADGATLTSATGQLQLANLTLEIEKGATGDDATFLVRGSNPALPDVFRGAWTVNQGALAATMNSGGVPPTQVTIRVDPTNWSANQMIAQVTINHGGVEYTGEIAFRK